MSIVADAVAGIFKPIEDVIDHVLPSGDARISLQKSVIDSKMQAIGTTLDYETKLMEAQSTAIKAEAEGNSWIQRSWRPITMLTFLALVVCDSFGWLPNRLAPEAWTLLQVGLGGYVAGRSLEKVAPAVTAAIKAATNGSASK